MNLLKIVDRTAFSVSVIAGITAAMASGLGWTKTAVAAGCITVIAPIINRIATARQQRVLLKQLGPRSLTSKQRLRLIESLRLGASFHLVVAHNRHEAEPSNFHKQIFDALSEAGLQTNWFGGMTNTTVGVEISGIPSAEKTRLMAAFVAAEIPFLPIEFTDAGADKRGIEVWIGVNPGPAASQS
ncbi:hypothetical protein [Dyella sp. Tek66A03]|uniref:hypothetical protein n=1 Tax=Dyella sp. Tek66A03 TaxID=3458298 RepID=UPI00403E8014